MALPGIDVTIEDRALVLPVTASGRSAYITILSDRGPHNRVVEVTSLDQFYELFGKPDYVRTGQPHYLAAKFLQRSNKLYVVRAVKLDDSTSTNNAHIAHATISKNTTTSTTTETYIFTNGSNTITASATTTTTAADNTTVGATPSTTVTGAHTSSVTTITVGSTTGFNTAGTIKIGTEQITYTGVTATTFTGCTRGANGTTAASYAGTEAVTALNAVDATQTTIPATSTTGFPTAGTILIGTEQITYTGTTATSFTGCTRGANATTAAVHNASDAIYAASQLSVTSTTGFSSAGTILLGSEQITYTGTTATTITGITRGANNTTIAAHAASTTVTEKALTPSQLAVGDWVVPSNVTDLTLAKQVISVDSTQSSLTLSGAWTGSTTATALTVKYFQPLSVTTSAAGDISQLTETTYTFTNGSVTVTTTTASTASVGDWIISANDHTNEVLAEQIISISTDLKTLTLNNPYKGTTSPVAEGAYKFNTAGGITTKNSLSTTATGILFHLYALGTGAYYNDIIVRGVRNLSYEKMYTDSNGNVLYPNLFVDLYIYKQNSDGTETLIEGPWTVSLVNTINNSVVRDINSGYELYLPTVVNNNSKYINVIEGANISDYILDSNAAALREYTVSLLTAGTVPSSGLAGMNGIGLGAGDDGVQFDTQGRLNISNSLIQGVLAQAYAGTLTSTDGTIELINQSKYPWYEFDYILAGGNTAAVQASALSLADNRSDVMLLGDTGVSSTSSASDLSLRQNSVTWNSYNAMLYVQYREIFDVFTGRNINITPVYHAIDRHLLVDARDWIAEPVAGIEKGAIQEPITLAYRANNTQLSDLIDNEMNPTIVETQGKYFIQQLTTWKRLSIMKRAHAVKFIHYIKKEIPKLLKDILQHKATPYWIGQARGRIEGFMNPFVVGYSSSERLTAVTNYSVAVNFDELRSELQITLTVKPIRSIEQITVSIIVV